MNVLDIGQTIKEHRKRLKLTQAELAKQAGISRTTLSSVENGNIDEIGLRRLIAICSHVGLAIEVAPLKPKRPTLNTLVEEQRGNTL